MDVDVVLTADELALHRHVVCLIGVGISVESGNLRFRGVGGVRTEHGEPSVDDYSGFRMES